MTEQMVHGIGCDYFKIIKSHFQSSIVSLAKKQSHPWGIIWKLTKGKRDIYTSREAYVYVNC